MKNKIKLNPSGPENKKKSPKKNMPLSTNPYPMIGKNILLLKLSKLKDNWNSNQFSLSQKELLSICLKPKRRKITSNYMSEEFSLWMTVKI